MDDKPKRQNNKVNEYHCYYLGVISILGVLIYQEVSHEDGIGRLLWRFDSNVDTPFFPVS